VEGVPRKRIEPPVTYRLELDIGEWSGGGTLLGEKILPEWS
jgi:hypothetical protein